MWLFLVFLAVPLVEIALFITVGGWLTLWPTLAIVVVTGAFGAALIRRQGLRTLDELRRAMDRLDDPLTPLAHGVMILLAGALLLTPGFFTDAVGLALLIPQVRGALLQRLAAGVRARAMAARRDAAFRFDHGEVIEGACSPPSEPPPPPHPPPVRARH